MRCKTVWWSLRYSAVTVVAVVDGDKIRDFRFFFVIDVTFEVYTVEGSRIDKSRELKRMQMHVRCGIKRFGGA